MARTIDEIIEDIRTWQKQTFHGATPAGAAAHLRKEAHEILDHVAMHNPLTGKLKEPIEPKPTSLINRDEAGEECIDAIFMIVQVMYLLDQDIAEHLERKLEKNKARRWQKPDENGVVEHVKD